MDAIFLLHSQQIQVSCIMLVYRDRQIVKKDPNWRSLFPLEGLDSLISLTMRANESPDQEARSRINFNSGSDYLRDKWLLCKSREPATLAVTSVSDYDDLLQLMRIWRISSRWLTMTKKIHAVPAHDLISLKKRIDSFDCQCESRNVK